jgi:phage-related baseplate assembly protein
MAGGFSTVDLSKLPTPDVVETLSFETVFNAMLADLIERYPSFSALVESDPAYKLLEVCAYRETILRQRVNDAARAVMLSFAKNSDLDQIAANFGVTRLLVEAGDPEAVPPTEDVYEDDDSLRTRVQLSPEGYTTAGSEGSYVFHGLSADADVKDIQAISPTPGVVTVYVLSNIGDGEASPDLVATVTAALNAENVRPLTDNVTVLSSSIVDYVITAELVLYDGPDSEVVRTAAVEAVTAYAEEQNKIGRDVTLSGLYAALHQAGVQRVNLTAPTANLAIGDGEASYCTAINVTVASYTDV